MDLPMQADLSDLDAAMGVLNSKIKEISADEAQKINKKAFTENNVSAFKFLGLVEENSSGIKLTDSGRRYNNSTVEAEKQEAITLSIKKIIIYDTTLEYLHSNHITSPTKTEIGAYWNDNFKEKVGDMTEDQIGNAVIFFLRLLEKIGLGKFIAAGRG